MKEFSLKDDIIGRIHRIKQNIFIIDNFIDLLVPIYTVIEEEFIKKPRHTIVVDFWGKKAAHIMVL